MYQWRKFEFFEGKYGGKVALPEEISGSIQCCTSGRGKVLMGCDDGRVSLLDRGLKFNYQFQAHSSTVLYLQQLKQRNFLVTVGEDEQMASQYSSVCMKIFDLDKMQEEGPSMSTPDCVQILRIFTNQFPEAKITSFLVLEEAPPILLVAIGLDNGNIYCIQGDITRERIKRFMLQAETGRPGKPQSSITGLEFRVDGQLLQLFAVTPNSVHLFNLHAQPPSGHIIDNIGSDVPSVAMSDRLELIIGRPEAIYFYEVDGRGPCWAFEGEKKFLGWFRGYLLCVLADQATGKYTFNVYDLKNKLVAHSVLVKEVSHLLCEWGNIMLIMKDKSAICIGEKDMESKLDMLFKKSLYTVAINIVHTQQADAAATAEVLRKYGDHLYSKQEYDQAMHQYIDTIGHLEPSYVIQKFLDAQRIYNLTNYLEKLHEKGFASKDHTTLLLNCYTKLKDVDKLDLFIKSDGGIGENRFDVETAIKVCRAAGYHEHAMYVAKKAGKHELYLKILLEDLGRYEEALQYINSLEPSQAGATIEEYGKILIEHKPAETIDILLRLCTEEESTKRASSSTYVSMLPSPVDFINIFVHRPDSLMDFLEKYTDKVKDSPAQGEIHNTLIELYLSQDLDFPSMSQTSASRVGGNAAGKAEVSRSSATAVNSGSEGKDRQERLKKGLNLLKSAWPPELDQPLYDVDLVIILCEMNSFKEGLLYLYEKMKLYKEVVSCYMQVQDHEGLISCCKRLGDVRTGGDPSLWADVLKYFGELGEDCSKEVREVLTYIERDDIVQPIVVLQTLSRNPCLTLSVIKDYIARKLDYESKLIEKDRVEIEKYQEQTSIMRTEIQDLQTNARIFQLSKCTACTFTLDLPAVHFLCMHSFHQRCLGDNEKECPECAHEYRSVMEMKRDLEQDSKSQDQFFQNVRSSKDGFSVIAGYFGKGIISKTSISQAGA